MPLVLLPVVALLGSFGGLYVYQHRQGLSQALTDALGLAPVLARIAQPLVQRLTSGIANFAAPRIDANMPATVEIVNNTAALAENIGAAAELVAQDTYNALHTLRAVTLPAVVTAHVSPLAEGLDTLRSRVAGAEADIADAPSKASVAALSGRVAALDGLPLQVATAQNTATAAQVAAATADAHAGAVAGDLGHLQDGTKVGAGLTAALAALVAVHSFSLVHATEAGLDTQACRDKVKGICSTPPKRWGNLLGGLALVTGTLSLSEILPVARTVFSGAEFLIREAA